MTDAGSTALTSASVAVRFLLELAALVVFGYWGYSLGDTRLVKFATGIGLPLVVAVVWGVFGSPGALYRLGQPWRAVLEVLILGGAAVALYLLDRPRVAVGFAVIAALNVILLNALGRA